MRGVTGRVHNGPHVGKPCRIPPCFRLGHVPGGDPLGPPLHLDGGGDWWCDERGPTSPPAHREGERLYEAYREARRPLQQAIKEAKRRAWDEPEGQPRLRSLRAPLQDGIEQTPPMGASRNGEHGPSVPGGGCRHPVPGSGERGRCQVHRWGGAGVSTAGGRATWHRGKLEPGIKGHRGRISRGCREDRSAESSGSRRSPGPPVEGRRRGLSPEINASIRQLPVLGRIPRFVEGGTLSGLAFRLSAVVPFRRGWQATGENGDGPPRVAFVPEWSRTARQPVWLPEGTVYGRRCRSCPLPGRGGQAAWLRGVGRVAGQRLQQHPLGQDMPGPQVSSGTRVPGGGPCVYTVSGGGMTERAVYRRVPQDSVLGPLLWNIAYDAVLRASMPPDSALAYYADDTLVLVWGTAWSRTVRLAELAVACVVAAIKGLGLRVSPEKSEAMWFCRRADHGTPPAGCRLRLEGAEIEVGTSMKYLGLTLDSHWTFGAHFERLAPSVEATVNALERLVTRGAFCARGGGGGVSLTPVPEPLSITAGTVIMKILVGWSPALPRRFPPEAAWCPCGFSPR